MWTGDCQNLYRVLIGKNFGKKESVAEVLGQFESWANTMKCLGE